MSADWTEAVSWTNQCAGIDWASTPPELKAEDLRVKAGDDPRPMVYPAYNGMAFIKVAEKEAEELQKKVEKDALAAQLRREQHSATGDAPAKKRTGSAIPGKWDHAERHKSHVSRYVAGRTRRSASLQALTVHVICRRAVARLQGSGSGGGVQLTVREIQASEGPVLARLALKVARRHLH